MREKFIPISVALTTPREPLTVVHAWLEDGAVQHEHIPVIAIRSTARHVFSYDSHDLAVAPSAETMIELGWRYHGIEMVNEPLVEVEGRIASASDEFNFGAWSIAQPDTVDAALKDVTEFLRVREKFSV